MKNILENEAKKISSIFNQIGLQDTRTYANWLAQTYFYVNHSVPLLALSIAHMSDEDKKNQQHFIKHISEENRHELLALRDLQKLNYSLDTFSELPETSMLYECQYYKIQHCDPMALMGYIIALEYLAVTVGPQIMQLTKDLNAHNFIKLHAQEDIDHVDKAIELVNSLDSVRKELIIKNLVQTFHAYKAVIFALNSDSQHAKFAA